MSRQDIFLREEGELEALRALARSRRAYAFARYLACHQKKPAETEKPKVEVKAQNRVGFPRKRLSA